MASRERYCAGVEVRVIRDDQLKILCILKGAESLISSDALCNDSQARRDGASHVVGGRGWGLKPSEVWSARDISALDLCGSK
jgi:hypothetical protein